MIKNIYFLSLFFIFQNLHAANSLSYSGRLVLASGAPVTGPVNLRAELVYTNNTSTVLCSQSLTSVALTKGVFHLKLDLNCAPKTLTQVLSETPNGESVAIRIIDQTNSKTYPLQAIHSVPFSKVAEQLPQMGASNGQALVWDGAKWAPTSVGTGNGTVMSVNTGAGLTGGPITTSGTISVAAGGITSTELAANSVTAAKINAGEITSAHISATANIPYSKLQIGVGEIPQDRINGLATSISALIEDVIADAVTGKAPSQNAVYDALQLKADRANVAQNITAASVVGLVAPTVGSAAANRDYVDTSAATLDTRITNEVGTLNTALGTKYDKTGGVISGDVTLNTQMLFKGGSNFVTVKANSGTGNYSLTLPTSAGTNGYVLRTDGAGVLSWVDPTSLASGASTVDSNSITDGSIVDADINSSANIAQSKILNLTSDLAAKQPLITAGTTSQYYRGDKIFADFGTEVRGTTLVGFTTGANTTIVNTDSTLSAFQKVQGQINATNTAVSGKEPTITGGTNVQYYRGDKTWQTLNGVAVANTPAGNISATNVQTALNELDTEKQANISSTSAITTGSITTSLQNGVNLNPFNTAAGSTGEVRFYELAANGSNYTSFKAPDLLSADINYVMPSVAPTAGQVLSSSAAGVLSWITIPSAPVTTVFGRSGAVTATAGDYTATQITNTPAGAIAATTVQAALNELDTEKQGLITAGTTAQYYRGDKTFVDLGTDVRGTALTGYAVGANTALTATDTTLSAFQKLQGQIDATNSAVAGKEPAITAGTTAQYIRGDKTLSTFATDAINSVLSSFAVGTGTKPAVINTDTVVGAFGKVQKTLNDINADYVSKTQNQTIFGTLAINSLTGFITVPTPLNPNDAANKAYVDSYGQWLKNLTDIYFNTGSVGVGTNTINSSAIFEITSTTKGFLPPRMTTAQRDAIASPVSGLTIYNTTTQFYEYYNGSAWNIMGGGVPNGSISAFESTTCPVGWVEYTAARGQFLRGIDNGAGVDPSGTRLPGNLQLDSNKSHAHTATSSQEGAHNHTGTTTTNGDHSHPIYAFYPGDTSALIVNDQSTDKILGTDNQGGPGFYSANQTTNAAGNHSHTMTTSTSATHNHSITVNADGATETRPKNIAVLFCRYVGGSPTYTPPALEGLSTVNVSSPSNGQALIFDSATNKWINQTIGSALGFTPVNKTGDTMTGALNLPANGLVVGTNQLVTAAGNVGVGVTNPNSKLEVAGEISGSSYKTKIYTAGGVNAPNCTLSSANTANVVDLFCDLTLTFTLSSPAQVQVSYSISMPSGPDGTADSKHLVTAISVNGTNVTRTISGNTLFWGINQTWNGNLAAGTHTIRVNYRTPAGGTNTPTLNDWHDRRLQVMVLGNQ